MEPLWTVELSNKSKIVASIDEAKTIEKFFDKKEIKTMELLYRASEFYFSAEAFHKLCDNMENTLVLC